MSTGMAIISVLGKPIAEPGALSRFFTSVNFNIITCMDYGALMND